jgi:ABC-type bacteriocin/lantibiotic exporter with double-glycine peptidase domain
MFRDYTEQQVANSWTSSIYEIVSRKTVHDNNINLIDNNKDIVIDIQDEPINIKTVYDDDNNTKTKTNTNTNSIDIQDEDIVWEALELCCCDDFLKRENISDNYMSGKKWIHTKNIGMSGGQKARISLARSIYRIFTNKPKMITLDEVDKSIQSELVCKIMKNIYKYTKENNILVFVICHCTDIKKLKCYDQIIHFEKGIIKKQI